MNTAPLRSSRLWIPTALFVLALAVAGVVWATTASAGLPGGERDRVARAATEAVGGGEVLSAESSDDDRTREAYEVEVRRADGTEVEVSLDQDLNVLGQDREDDSEDRRAGDRGSDRRSDDHGSDGFDSPGDDSRDDDERALSATERTSAENAARAALGGGTVTKVEAEDDGGEAYEVEVRRGDGTLWDVALDTDFDVLEKSLDD